MKFTQIPADTFKQIQLNAGVLVKTFTPESGTIGDIIGATSGNVTFAATPTFSDYGDDINNCPKNMLELKKLDSIEAKLSGSFVTVTAASIKGMIGAADVDSADATHVVPRKDLLEADFDDIWWVGDYSDLNGDSNGGFCAIHLMNALSTGGFQISAGDKSKGSFTFEYTAHFSMEAQSTVPYEIYIKAGTAEPS